MSPTADPGRTPSISPTGSATGPVAHRRPAAPRDHVPLEDAAPVACRLLCSPGALLGRVDGQYRAGGVCDEVMAHQAQEHAGEAAMAAAAHHEELGVGGGVQQGACGMPVDDVRLHLRGVGSGEDALDGRSQHRSLCSAQSVRASTT